LKVRFYLRLHRQNQVNAEHDFTSPNLYRQVQGLQPAGEIGGCEEASQRAAVLLTSRIIWGMNGSFGTSGRMPEAHFKAI
jgi:hypothetical protein